MNNISAVQFETASRIHMGLAVKDVERSKAFYSALFGLAPTKTRPRYARFEVAEPPLNLSLNEVGGATGQSNPVAHFGIQLKSVLRRIAKRSNSPRSKDSPSAKSRNDWGCPSRERSRVFSGAGRCSGKFSINAASSTSTRAER